ncbi:MAG TPA: hypothetical protein VGJ39_08990 [Vicinamibacterales bacterium]
MKTTTRNGRAGIVLALALMTGLGAAASAQIGVTSADIQRLQDNVYEASRDVTQLRSRDAVLASQLQAELDDARDEVVYLKVKLRKNERLDRNEYLDLRDRIDAIRSRARGDATFGGAPTSPAARDDRPASTTGRTSSTTYDVPVGTEFDVRLQNHLSSATAQVEDRFEATTLVDYRQGNRVIVPAGSVMRGVVSSVKKAGRLERTGSLTLAFDRITINGRSYPIRATVVDALESEGIKGEAGKIGTAAGVGAVIGAILGGAKGALAGILIGAGGTVAATEGKDVDLPPGTVLRVRLDSGLNVR